MATASEKYRELIDRLSNKTEADELKWRETANPNMFQVSFPNYSITISKEKDPLEIFEYIIIVGIVNSEGKGVDLFTQHDIGSNYAGQLSNLYQKARRQALGAEKALDEILNALKDAR
jgi:hypothetical protein